MNERPPTVPPLRRRDVHPEALVDGLPVRDGPGARLARQVQRALTSRAEREEAVLEHRIRSQPAPTRPNVIAVASAKGGVGKSSVAYVLGNLLATHLRLRAVAVDANPDVGTLGRMPPERRCSDRSPGELLADADHLRTAAELNPYVSRLATGLHVLGAPVGASLTGRVEPGRYGELVAFLSCFYEVVLLDLATGVDTAVVRAAVERADHVLLVSTPDRMTVTLTVNALPELPEKRTTLVLNKWRGIGDERLAGWDAAQIPYDLQLATMLDAGSYALDATGRATRVAIKQLGLATAERLV